jgi:hypothetical protein
VLLSLVDSLRCPAHDDPWPLVLSVERWDNERVREGVLGCPLCQARYFIREGGVDFTPGTVRRPSSNEGADALRLAAQLGLSEPGGTILLTGRYANVHETLISLADVTCILIDGAPSAASKGVTFVIADRLPIVDGALRGAAVDSRSSPPFLADVMRSLRPGGRIVAPATASLPEGVNVLARDQSEWVGQVESRLDPIPIIRRKR